VVKEEVIGASFCSCLQKPNSFLHLEEIMKWEAPDFEEINLCCEINSYASAEL
jgi:coenzyme PQQ precursor peptide PqqA